MIDHRREVDRDAPACGLRFGAVQIMRHRLSRTCHEPGGVSAVGLDQLLELAQKDRSRSSDVTHGCAAAPRFVTRPLLAHREPQRYPRRDDPFALLWPALSTSQQQTLLATARRWPNDIRARIQQVARLPASPSRSRSRFDGSRVQSMTSVRSTK